MKIPMTCDRSAARVFDDVNDAVATCAALNGDAAMVAGAFADYERFGDDYAISVYQDRPGLSAYRLGWLAADAPADRPAYLEPFFPAELREETFRRFDGEPGRFRIMSARSDVETFRRGEAWRAYQIKPDGSSEACGDVYMGSRESVVAWLTSPFGPYVRETPRERYRAFVLTSAGRSYLWSRLAVSYSEHARMLNHAARYRRFAARDRRLIRDARKELSRAAQTRAAWMERSI